MAHAHEAYMQQTKRCLSRSCTKTISDMSQKRDPHEDAESVSASEQ